MTIQTSDLPLDRVRYGFLSPAAGFYECRYGDHFEFANDLFRQLGTTDPADQKWKVCGEYKLLNDGWLRISYESRGGFSSHGVPNTRQQLWFADVFASGNQWFDEREFYEKVEKINERVGFCALAGDV